MNLAMSVTVGLDISGMSVSVGLEIIGIYKDKLDLECFCGIGDLANILK